MAEKLLSRLAWIGIDALISSVISSLYNYTLSLIPTIPLPSLPTIIPIGLAIGGFSLIGYHFWSRKKREKLIDIIQKEQKQKEMEQKQKEMEQLEKSESSNPQRQKENEDRFTPSNVK